MLFHEASCLALLEAVLFHRDAVEALQEAGPDLTDYCVRYMKNTLLVLYKIAFEKRKKKCINQQLQNIKVKGVKGTQCIY